MTTTIIVLQGVALVILLLLLWRTHQTLARLVNDIEAVGRVVSIIRDEIRNYRYNP
jgi:hypothetical protein